MQFSQNNGFEEIHSTGSQVFSQWPTFRENIKHIRSYSSGRYYLKILPYNVNLIHPSNQKSGLQRIFATPENSGQRGYLLYVPQCQKSQGYNLPLLILLHGTGSTMFTSQLILKGNRTVWMDLADKQKFIIAVPQSRMVTVNDRKNIVWQPGTEDIFYLNGVINDIINSDLRSENGVSVSIDRNNINFIGKSNGGLFVSQIYLAYLNKKNQSWVSELRFKPNLFCNYMGGMQAEQLQQQIIHFDQSKKSTPLLIMTCPGEDNYIPCVRASIFFSHQNCNAYLMRIDHDRHEFIPEAASIIYDHISVAYSVQKSQQQAVSQQLMHGPKMNS